MTLGPVNRPNRPEISLEVVRTWVPPAWRHGQFALDALLPSDQQILRLFTAAHREGAAIIFQELFLSVEASLLARATGAQSGAVKIWFRIQRDCGLPVRCKPSQEAALKAALDAVTVREIAEVSALFRLKLRLLMTESLERPYPYRVQPEPESNS